MLKMFGGLSKGISILVLVSALTACSSAQYAKKRSNTTKVFDAAVRYGSVAAASAGGGFGTYALTKNPYATAAGAVASGGLMYAFNVFGDKKQQEAYDTGVEDGANSARAEILQEAWRREAIYGIKDDKKKMQFPTVRRVYVPSYESNGVTLQGGYQAVDYYR